LDRRYKGSSHWIRELNLRAAAEIDRAALASERRQSPVNLMGAQRMGHVDPRIRAAVLDAEIGFLSETPSKAIQGDQYPIDYDSAGYPELPACLDRRQKPTLAEAA
jgi:hypothetical protein